MTNKTALLFGATGLTGSFLLQELLKEEAYSNIVVVTRKETGVRHNKIHELVTDFRDRQLLNEVIKADVLFCCLGTTIKKAGSQAAFRKVDLELPLLLAEIASKNNVPAFIIMSSIGAKAGTSNFYLRTKGEMENGVLKAGIPNVAIFRPSMLMGARAELRLAEFLGKIAINALSPLFSGPFRKYKPIESKDVARAMLRIAASLKGKQIIESSEIQKIADQVEK